MKFKTEIIQNISNIPPMKIEKFSITQFSVDFIVMNLKTNKLEEMDITEILTKRELLNKEDNFYLGTFIKSIGLDVCY